jgi:hypothetical protein
MDDWTVDPETGRSNSSARYKELVAVIERLIRDDAHMLLSGHAECTAGLILAHLTHKYGFAPTDVTNEGRE